MKKLHDVGLDCLKMFWAISACQFAAREKSIISKTKDFQKGNSDEKRKSLPLWAIIQTNNFEQKNMELGKGFEMFISEAKKINTGF